ncbi:MAG: dihydrodipicolinate reductase [bacterium]
MNAPITVVQYGLGPIGLAAAKLVCQKRELELVGGIDIDPAKVGMDLGAALGLERNLETEVSDDAASLLARTQPDIVLHSTGSFLKDVATQLETCIKAKVPVVSSCEELFYPNYRHPDLSKELDALAKEFGVAVMGTGVNPGFSMDVLALTLTGVCAEVNKIESTRIVDASKRRLPLQKKIGAGLQPDEFRNLVQAGKLGHIGLLESLVSVADALGWRLDDIQESIDPKIAENVVTTPYLQVLPGQVAGIVHVVKGVKEGQERIKLELQMFVGAENPCDCVHIEGNPPIELRIAGGIFGDTATVARMVNAIPAVLTASPGILTPMNIPVLYYLG